MRRGTTFFEVNTACRADENDEKDNAGAIPERRFYRPTHRDNYDAYNAIPRTHFHLENRRKINTGWLWNYIFALALSDDQSGTRERVGPLYLEERSKQIC